ncbi:MAG TPA: histidinol dehydrogenase [Bacteroidales bacterium]|nr:histidinol dehydrogenase [Bacteroidales bacterium]
MQIITDPPKNKWPELLARPLLNSDALEDSVKKILEEVRQEGDRAVRSLTKRFDGADIPIFRVTPDEFDQADARLSSDTKKAIATAIENITRFHKAQMPAKIRIETTPGVQCWQKSVPVHSVGLYVPGGSAPLFSTVLMLGIPARLAGCERIIVCTPPGKDAAIHPAILYSAKAIGITEVYKVGGVQAIAAMAYGTETIPAVNKIFGPGNQYVTIAKQIVSRQGVAIDLPAGPSEVLVVADETAIPSFVASDLLAQAEHGPDSQVILITTHPEIVEPILSELKTQLAALPRRNIAEKSLSGSKVFIVRDNQTMMDMVNEYAPEHLIIAARNAETLAELVVNAGSVFIGNYSPESAGDYASGTNHTLPTYGYAKVFGGVSIDSFMKKITFQELSEFGLRNLGPAVMNMAAVEELEGHRNAVKIRFDYLSKKQS